MHAIPVQRSALKQRSECVGRGAKYREFACMGGIWGETSRECVIARMYEYSVKRNAKTRTPKKEEGWKRNMRAVCKTTCSCYLHRGREEAENCEMTTTGKRGEKWFAWARGRVSWDPVVADPPIRGVQSEDWPCRGQAFRGCDKRGAWRKEAQSARTRVANGSLSAEPRKGERTLSNRGGGEPLKTEEL